MFKRIVMSEVHDLNEAWMLTPLFKQSSSSPWILFLSVLETKKKIAECGGGTIDFASNASAL
jgi:hypothetical protein